MGMEFVGEGVGKLEAETMSFLVERTELRGACDWLLCGLWIFWGRLHVRRLVGSHYERESKCLTTASSVVI